MRVQTLVTSQIVKEHTQASTLGRFNSFSVRIPEDASRMVVGLGGLEPPTSPLSGARSNHLSYRPKDLRSGGADRDRTGDPLLAKQVLSQLS